MLLAATSLHASSAASAACTGDCNGNGIVTVDELLAGVNIALGVAPLSACASFDTNNDRRVTVDELLAAVNAALTGCAPTATPTPAGTPTSTPTSGPNQAPVLPCSGVYQAFTGQEIQFPIAASDPDGDALQYTAGSLPDGAQLDADTGILTWTPSAQQTGPFYVPVTVSDDRMPPLSAQSELTFEVMPSDACTQVMCDPATGCESTFVTPNQNCCPLRPPVTRLAEPLADCPYGRALYVGRNASGFGRLQDCDFLQVGHLAQSSAYVAFNVEARCVNYSDPQHPPTLHARLEVAAAAQPSCTPEASGLCALFDVSQLVLLAATDNGYGQHLSVRFPVQPAGPFFGLEGAEANFSLTLTDADGVTVSEELRVVLTFDDLADLAEAPDVAPPGATCPTLTPGVTNIPPPTSSPTPTVEPQATPATLQQIQDTIFTPHCAIGTCHDSGSAAQNLDLSAGASYSQLVNVPSVDAAGVFRVDPGKPDDSFLVIKVQGPPPPGEGSQMPLAGPLLNTDQIQLIRNWILEGANP